MAPTRDQVSITDARENKATGPWSRGDRPQASSIGYPPDNATTRTTSGRRATPA